MLKNGYVAQLMSQYKTILKKQGVNHKNIKEYTLLVIEKNGISPSVYNPPITIMQLRRLEQIADNNTKLSNNDEWAVIKTTLHPREYVYELLQIDIKQYARKNIKITLEGKYTLRDFLPQF